MSLLRLMDACLNLVVFVVILQASEMKKIDDLPALSDFRERVSYLISEASILSQFKVDLDYEAPHIARDSAIRVGAILEKHFQKLKQNCEYLELEARYAEETPEQTNTDFFPAKNLMDFNISLAFSKKSVNRKLFIFITGFRGGLRILSRKEFQKR